MKLVGLVVRNTNLNDCTDVGMKPLDEIFIWGGRRVPLFPGPYFTSSM